MDTMEAMNNKARGDLLSFQKSLHQKLRDDTSEAVELFVPIISDGERWAFCTREIAKVADSESYSPVPGVDRKIVGVTSLAGVIYTVLDFNLLRSLPPTTKTLKSRLVFLTYGIDSNAPVALLVDRVLDPIPLDAVSVDVSDKRIAAHSIGLKVDVENHVYQVPDLDWICGLSH